MPATVSAERGGLDGSDFSSRTRVADLRPALGPVALAAQLTYQPGNQTQCDLWFPPARIPLGHG